MAYNPFFVQPGGDITQGLAGISQVYKENRMEKEAKAQKEMEAARAAESRAAAVEAYESGDPSKMMEAVVKYPELQKTAEQAFGFWNDQEGKQPTKPIVLEAYRNIITNPSQAEATMVQAINDVVEKTGEEPKNMLADLGMLRENPEAFMQKARMGVAAGAPEEYKALVSMEEKKEGDPKLDIEREGLEIRRLEAKERSLDRKLQREVNDVRRRKLEQDIVGVQAEREQKMRDTEAAQEEDLQKVDNSIQTIDRLLEGKGLESAAGFGSAFPTLPGGKAADFEAELETFQSQAFLNAVKQMKGMGALSENEGKKLAAAVGALSPTMSDKALRSSLERIRSKMLEGKERMYKKYGREMPVDDEVIAEEQITQTSPEAQHRTIQSGRFQIEVQ